MKRTIAVFFLTMGMMSLYVGVAQASYYASCKAKIYLHSLHYQKKKKKKKGTYAKVTFSIRKVVSTSGHSDRACSSFLRKRSTRSFFVPKKLVKKLKRGTVVLASYVEWNSMTPKGVVSGGSWRFLVPPRK